MNWREGFRGIAWAFVVLLVLVALCVDTLHGIEALLLALIIKPGPKNPSTPTYSIRTGSS